MHASPSTVAFLRRYYDAIDNRRVQEVLGCFADDATMRPPTGGAPVNWREGFQATATTLSDVVATEHELTAVLEGEDGQVGYEVQITYTLRSGEKVTLPGAVFCVIRGERFQQQNLYADWTPLLGAAAEA